MNPENTTPAAGEQPPVSATISQRVKSIISEVLILTADPKDEDDLRDTCGADSLDIVDVAVRIESEFHDDLNGGSIDDRELAPLKTVAELVAYVEKRIVAAAAK